MPFAKQSPHLRVVFFCKTLSALSTAPFDAHETKMTEVTERRIKKNVGFTRGRETNETQLPQFKNPHQNKKGGPDENKVQIRSLGSYGSRRLNHRRRWILGMANRYCSRKVCRKIGSYGSSGNSGISACLYPHLRRNVLVTNNLKTTTMAKRRNKTVSQQCKYYEVDNIFEYMAETYINGNISSFKELYQELNKDARKDFTDFLLSEVEPTYWREILKATI